MTTSISIDSKGRLTAAEQVDRKLNAMNQLQSAAQQQNALYQQINAANLTAGYAANLAATQAAQYAQSPFGQGQYGGVAQVPFATKPPEPTLEITEHYDVMIKGPLSEFYLMVAWVIENCEKYLIDWHEEDNQLDEVRATHFRPRHITLFSTTDIVNFKLRWK